MRAEQASAFEVVDYAWEEGPGSELSQLVRGRPLGADVPLAGACRARGFVPTVLLAATDARIARYRHPLPTDTPLERRAMIVASAQRGGLYANLTKVLWFDDPDSETLRRQAACDEILARMRGEATLAGRTLADCFADLRRFTPYTEVEIEPGMAFSWNPSVTGAKSEETFVLHETGPELVTPASLAAA